MSRTTRGRQSRIPALTDDTCRLLSRKEVAAMIDMSVSTVQRMVQRGTFPSPIRLSARCVRWPLDLVTRWVHAVAHGDVPRTPPHEIRLWTHEDIRQWVRDGCPSTARYRIDQDVACRDRVEVRHG
jgi:prophage regulatory protein